jgi:transposase
MKKYSQSAKRNQRIERITENTLIVGVDIAKQTHVARALDFRGIELGKGCVFENDREGFLKLTRWMKELQQEYGKEAVVLGIEPTGHYWFSLREFLKEYGVRVMIVNPHHVKKSKELEDNSPTKNDYKDAKLIADLLRNGNYTEPHLPEGIYADLRTIMNVREKLQRQLQQVKNHINRWLECYFPEYTQVFKSSWESKSSMITLHEFPTPDEIVQMGAQAIFTRWKQEVKRGVGLKRAEELVEAAANSIGVREGLSAARLELSTWLAQYQMYMQQVETLMSQAEKLLSQIPGVVSMLSIPSIGTVTLAGFLAEVGDLSKYQHPQQIVRLAGLHLKENSSGQKKGETTITKRGRARLRALLFRAVLPMVAKNKDFAWLHQYYTRRAHNPLKKKQSLIALCRKLIRVLYTLGTRCISYDSAALLGPIQKAHYQMDA